MRSPLAGRARHGVMWRACQTSPASLMLSFAAAGIWNDWVQARGAVQREALALENVLALVDGLSPERAAKVRAGVLAYARAAAEQEWPAMAEQVDMDDPLYDVSDRVA